MGPANVAAIKAGDIQFDYDMPFLFSMINADLINWVYNHQLKNWQKVSVDKNASSTRILNKKKGTGILISSEPEDITENYRHPKDSKEYQQAIQKASRFLGLFEQSDKLLHDEIEFQYLHNSTQAIGSTIDVAYKISNKSYRNLTVELQVFVSNKNYRGNARSLVHKKVETLFLFPKECKFISLNFYIINNVI